MANKHGDFIWYELLTSDADMAGDFYSEVVGWSVGDSGQEGMDYRILSMPTGQVAGLMALTPEMEANGARPCWMGYIAVEDVDACAGRIEAAGGGMHVPPTDIPGVGRFAFVNDPQGVMFYIMNDSSGQESNAFAATEPMLGHCAWNELSTTDPEAAKAFYGTEFGWVQDGDMDMGPLGKYEFWWDREKRFMLGAVMPKMAEMPVPFWTYYFRVADIDKAVETIKANGGTIMVEPMEIPGGDFSLNAMDPQGAAFALVGPRLD
jgi:predicted enzyme related to lactoylglutathione lyase